MKLSIINTQVIADGDNKTVDVYLTCCPNLKWFEEQFTCLSPKFIKKTVSNYLQTFSMMYETPVKNEGFEIVPSQPIINAPVRVYEYVDMFTVRGTATGDIHDKFDLEFGRQLAESRAKVQAYEIMRKICRDLADRYQKIVKELRDCESHMDYMKAYERDHQDEIINKKY